MKPWFDNVLFYLQQHQLTLDQFLQAGGWVMNIIGLLCVVLFALLAERYWFRWVSFAGLLRKSGQALNQQSSSSASLWQQQSLCCDLKLAMTQRLPLIRTLIALCPLLGLLGTVSGMIQVFDTLAMNGTGNPRLMAAGIASATLPTLAGMAISVTGLLLYSHLKTWSDRLAEQLPSMLSLANKENNV